jgi:hypothetical protein
MTDVMAAPLSQDESALLDELLLREARSQALKVARVEADRPLPRSRERAPRQPAAAKAIGREVGVSRRGFWSGRRAAFVSGHVRLAGPGVLIEVDRGLVAYIPSISAPGQSSSLIGPIARAVSEGAFEYEGPTAFWLPTSSSAEALALLDQLLGIFDFAEAAE